MRQSIQQRINGVVYQTVKEAALGAQFETDVTACYAPTLNQQGQITGFEHSWLVTVSTPNPLLGLKEQERPDIAVSVPVRGVVPPAAIFEEVARGLWQKCAAAKDEVLTKPTALGADLGKLDLSKVAK